ncbi:transposase domain-containing protein [Streptomyces sp. NPDC002537]
MFAVAADSFAPGHLGELTEVVPFELVDAVLEEAGCVQHRLRDLPSRVGVYFLLAMCLFPEVGYRLVWNKLTAALAGVGLKAARRPGHHGHHPAQARHVGPYRPGVRGPLRHRLGNQHAVPAVLVPGAESRRD